jgi:hypothetical protein
MTIPSGVASRGEYYLIRVKGHLGPELASWFDGLTVSNQPNGEAVLGGLIPDQAALHGILGRIRDLGLPLLAVYRVDPIP